MRLELKGLLCIGLLASATALTAGVTSGKTFFAHRPQSANTARELVGWGLHINQPDMDKVYGSFSITPEYTRSFNKKAIGKYLFFNDSNEMVFGAPAIATGVVTSGVDVAAINFGLAADFNATVKALPRVENFLVDFNFYLGLDEWLEGLYTRIHAPVVWTRWNVDLTETTNTGTSTTFQAGKVKAGTTTPAVATNSIVTAWKGQSHFGDMITDWAYGKIDGKRTKTRLSDIELALGYNFINKEKGYLGLNVRGIFPTGNKPNAEYVFEPVVGTGKHWGIGGGIDAKAVLWDKDEDQSFSLFLVGNINHLFKVSQTRSFDMVNNGKGSRYLLLKEFTSVPAYNNNLINAINIMTLGCDVTVDVMGEGSLDFIYKNGGFTGELGYNIWGRSKEKVSVTGTIEKDKYAIYNFTWATAGDNNTASATKIDGSGVAAADATRTYVKTADADHESAESPSALSHKVFGHLAYNWFDNDFCPFLGIGAEGEFSGQDNNALNQWGVWLKGGFCF